MGEQAVFLLEILGEDLFPCLFEFLQASHSPWLVALWHPNLCFFDHLFSSCLTLLPPSCGDPCVYVGLTEKSRNDLPTLRALT